jgi:hypothetical protein
MGFAELSLERAKANGRTETRYYLCEQCTELTGRDTYHLTGKTINEFITKKKEYDKRNSL